MLTAHAGTQPEIRFANSIVQVHLVSTFRAEGLLFQAVLSFLIRDPASRGATQPIYGLRDEGWHDEASPESFLRLCPC